MGFFAADPDSFSLLRSNAKVADSFVDYKSSASLQESSYSSGYNGYIGPLDDPVSVNRHSFLRMAAPSS